MEIKIIQHGVKKARKRWRSLRRPLPGGKPTVNEYVMTIVGESVIERAKTFLPRSRTSKPISGRLTLREVHGLEAGLEFKVVFMGRGVRILAPSRYRIHEEGGTITAFRAPRLIFSVTPGKEIGEVGAEVRSAKSVRMPRRPFLQPSIKHTLRGGGKVELDRKIGRSFRDHFRIEGI